MQKGTRWSKFLNFSFLHKTEKCHRIYFLVFLLQKSEENLINDTIKCCHYNDKFYYVTWSYTETKCVETRYYILGWELPRPTLYASKMFIGAKLVTECNLMR